jgi:hypothetical protein
MGTGAIGSIPGGFLLVFSAPQFQPHILGAGRRELRKATRHGWPGAVYFCCWLFVASSLV